MISTHMIKKESFMKAGEDKAMIDWVEYLNENDDIAPLTLMAAEKELTKKPHIDLSSIEVEKTTPIFEEVMEGVKWERKTHHKIVKEGSAAMPQRKEEHKELIKK